MSKRMTMDEVLKEYGVPQIKLDVHATRSELLKLREKLMAIRDLSGGKEQGYLDIDCKLYIDVDDIDRYLSGELDTIGEIYAFRRTSRRTGKSDRRQRMRYVSFNRFIA